MLIFVGTWTWVFQHSPSLFTYSPQYIQFAHLHGSWWVPVRAFFLQPVAMLQINACSAARLLLESFFFSPTLLHPPSNYYCHSHAKRRCLPSDSGFRVCLTLMLLDITSMKCVCALVCVDTHVLVVEEFCLHWAAGLCALEEGITSKHADWEVCPCVKQTDL